MTDFFETPADTLSIVESQAKDVKLAKADVQSIADSEANAFILVLSDSISFSDSEIETPIKGLLDTQSLSEEITEKAVATPKTDSISIAEQLANLATLRVSDTQSFAESASLHADFIRDFTDSQSIVEAIAKAIRPFLTDSHSLAESISKIAVQLNLNANQTFAEEMAKNIGLGKTDTLGIAEAVAKAIGLYKDDSQSISEAEAWFFNKLISDQITPFAGGSVLYDVTLEVWWGAIKWRTACHGGL